MGVNQRYDSWLVRGPVPQVDCSTSEGFQRALNDFVKLHLPVVMDNLDLMPAALNWNIDYLRAHTTHHRGMTVLQATGGDNRYLYYQPEQSDRDMAFFKDAPRQASQDHLMS